MELRGELMKGLIICGYPGVGKSSIAGWNNCIDLESSYFSRVLHPGEYVSDLLKYEWVIQYCRVAMDLAMQGYTVLTSTHEQVIKYFIEHTQGTELSPSLRGVVVFCPDHRYKPEWIERLNNRLCQDAANHLSIDILEKDLRALRRVVEHFNEDMDFLYNCGLSVYIPGYMDYDLKDQITAIRFDRERVWNDSHETISKTNSSLEQMAGVEEARLDDPVVEENSNTFRNCSE